MIQNLAFNDPIKTFYYRNNRSTRQKSLRCFPSCAIKGHVGGGYCGKVLTVTLTLQPSADSGNTPWTSIMFVLQIRPSHEPCLSAKEYIHPDDIFQKLRSKSERDVFDGELFLAQVHVLEERADSVDLELQFNNQNCSWDYSWKSNRWKGAQQTHVVDIIALCEVETNKLKVLSSGASTPFFIASSHKKASKDEDFDRRKPSAVVDRKRRYLMTTECRMTMGSEVGIERPSVLRCSSEDDGKSNMPIDGVVPSTNEGYVEYHQSSSIGLVRAACYNFERLNKSGSRAEFSTVYSSTFTFLSEISL